MPDDLYMSSTSITPPSTMVNLFYALLQANRILNGTLTVRANVLYKYLSFLSRASRMPEEVSPPNLRCQTELLGN